MLLAEVTVEDQAPAVKFIGDDVEVTGQMADERASRAPHTRS